MSKVSSSILVAHKRARAFVMDDGRISVPSKVMILNSSTTKQGTTSKVVISRHGHNYLDLVDCLRRQQVAVGWVNKKK